MANTKVARPVPQIRNVNHTNAAVGKPLTVMGRVMRCMNIKER